MFQARQNYAAAAAAGAVGAVQELYLFIGSGQILAVGITTFVRLCRQAT